MPRYWGFHNTPVHPADINHHLVRRTRVYPGIPIDGRMRSGDYVYLFWQNESLYGWGTINRLGEKQGNLEREVTILFSVARQQLAVVDTDIRNNPIFENYDRLRDGPLSTFNDDQIRYLNQLCMRGGSSPPDPVESRENVPVGQVGPVVEELIRGRRIRLEEDRVTEFKEVLTVGNRKQRILDELEKYVIGFLNLEDRRGADVCRILWGVRNDREVVGFQADYAFRDEVQGDINNKLRGIKPPLAQSGFGVRFHEVRDDVGAVIPDTVVLEVYVNEADLGDSYCFENDTFYIRGVGSSPKLKGQALIKEIKSRVRKELQNA